MRRVYLDHNATTPMSDEVRAAMRENFDVSGNASSMHEAGRLAKTKVEAARKSVASLVGAPVDSIIFTSGGSEGNNMVLNTMRGLIYDGSERNELIMSEIEHPSVLNAAKFLETLGIRVHYLPVDEYGKVKLDRLGEILSEKTLLVSVMMANNEIGTIQNISEIAEMAKRVGAFVHTDAVQAVGKVSVDVEDLGADYLTMSAHKIYGPKGVGALYVRDGAPIVPLILGGHQEKGLRAGTYNNLGIIGVGVAAELAQKNLERYREHVQPLRDRLRDELSKLYRVSVNGHLMDVLPNTLNMSFPGAEGESILLALDNEGIEVSTGSACASDDLAPSHVLMATTGGNAELAHGSIRFSLGLDNTMEDIDYVIEKLPPIIEKLRAISTVA